MTRICLLCLPLLLASPALAQVAVTLPLEKGGNVESVGYSCGTDGSAEFTVQYVNAGSNSLAIVPIDDAERIFVNVIAASGARYVAGEYEWWVKGDDATLTNQMDQANPRDCKVAG